MNQSKKQLLTLVASNSEPVFYNLALFYYTFAVAYKTRFHHFSW